MVMYLGNKGGVRKVNKEQDGSNTYILINHTAYLTYPALSLSISANIMTENM